MNIWGKVEERYAGRLRKGMREGQGKVCGKVKEWYGGRYEGSYEESIVIEAEFLHYWSGRDSIIPWAWQWGHVTITGNCGTSALYVFAHA